MKRTMFDDQYEHFNRFNYYQVKLYIENVPIKISWKYCNNGVLRVQVCKNILNVMQFSNKFKYSW